MLSRKRFTSLISMLGISLKDFMDSLETLMMFGVFLKEEITRCTMSLRLLMLLMLSIRTDSRGILEWDQPKLLMMIQEIGVLLTKCRN